MTREDIQALKASLPIDLFIGINPAVKGNYKRAWIRGGKAIIAPDPKTMANERTLVAALAMHPSRPAVPLDEALRVDVEIRLAVPAGFSGKKRARALAGEERPSRRPDRGNFLKMVEDALEKSGYVVDDARIVEGDVSKVYAEVPGWRIVVASPGLPGSPT